jgi:hypothetical protein
LDLLFQKAIPTSDFVSISPSFDTESSMEFSKQNQEDSVWNEIKQEEAGTLFKYCINKDRKNDITNKRDHTNKRYRSNKGENERKGKK